MGEYMGLETQTTPENDTKAGETYVKQHFVEKRGSLGIGPGSYYRAPISERVRNLEELYRNLNFLLLVRLCSNSYCTALTTWYCLGTPCCCSMLLLTTPSSCSKITRTKACFCTAFSFCRRI